MIYKVAVVILAISVACKASPISPKLPNFFGEGSFGPVSGILDGIKGAIDFALPGGRSFGPEGFDLIDIERFRPRPETFLETDTIFDIDRGYGADSAVVVETDDILDTIGGGFQSDGLDITVAGGENIGILGDRSESEVVVETDDILDTFGGGLQSDGLDITLVEGGGVIEGNSEISFAK